jgi:LacI family transcriptional regulator
MTGKKEVTIYDIAKRLNLSASTVSRGLNGHSDIRKETIRRINLTAQAMGYQQNTFARNLRKNRSNTIGVILPRLDSNFQSLVVAGIESQVNKNGFNLIISQSRESMLKEKENIKTLFNSRIDGLLISLAADTSNLDHLGTIFKKGIPVVFFDRVKDHPRYKCSKVIIDNVKAGFDATEHLIEQGCNRIVYLSDNRLSNVYSERHKGYMNALEQYKIPYDPELIIEDKLNEESGKRTVAKLLKIKNLPDGIFATNDTSAVAIICQLKQEGIRVPKDIAVVGFNDVHISRVIDPSLTTIHYPGMEMGEIAASTLIELLAKEEPKITKTVVLDHKLIIRKSSLRKEALQSSTVYIDV